MKRISKQQQKTLADLVCDLQRHEEAIQEAIDTVGSAVADYNGTVCEVREVCEEVANEIEAYMNDRSEKWHDSEKGHAYQSWLDAWQEVSVEEVETPDAPEYTFTFDDIDCLPEEPEC